MANLAVELMQARYRQQNVERRYFLPEAILLGIMSEEAISSALSAADMPLHDLPDLVTNIMGGARKCFAILVSIGSPAKIAGFFMRDALLESHPDDRLPYNAQALEQILEEDEKESLVIKQFLEIQWEFTIPIFHQQTLYRRLDDETILPFLKRESAGTGAMGTVWKVQLHSNCHRLPLENDTVIQKQIKSGPGTLAAFHRERENLALLSHLKHPNIIQLYCSYSHRGEYSFIFAVAEGGTLAEFLNGKLDGPVQEAPKGPQLLLALTDLASAINAMHNFTAENINLTRSGCHHDLAPRNILIHGDTFLLADFGLSTFKDPEEDSQTRFKDVHAMYAAPESQLLPSFTNQQVGRANDIWSFGCIMSEVLTHMVLGSEGVAQFRVQRRFQATPTVRLIRFYDETEAPSNKVVDWLHMLQETNGEAYFARLVVLIKAMLSKDPANRPRSARVLAALRVVAVLAVAAPVEDAFGDASYSKQSNNVNMWLSKRRFESWLLIFRQSLDRNEDSLESFTFDYQKTIQALQAMHSSLSKTDVHESAIPHHLKVSVLRAELGNLTEALPPDTRSAARDEFVRNVLQGDNNNVHEDDAEEFSKLSAAMKESGDGHIGALLAFRHLVTLADRGDLMEKKELILDYRQIEQENSIDIHHIASLRPTNERVIVEWLRYGGAWADEQIREVLRQRLTSVVGLLNATSAAHIPGTLHCRGLFHDPTLPAIGVVYDVPDLLSTPVTLHTLLSEKHRPLLEYRFELALALCQSIYAFHQVGWLHRNIHSMNVLFFPPQGTPKTRWAATPRIVGFSSSRENRLETFSHGPDIQSQLSRYQHPDYIVRHERYREDFDYYSVGIILLEIGLWETLKTLTGSQRFQQLSADRFREELVSTRLPALGVAMGTDYMECTRACLEGGFSRSDTPYMLFKSRVLDRIPRLR